MSFIYNENFIEFTFAIEKIYMLEAEKMEFRNTGYANI
jgi:hypothetical protein